MRVPAHDMVLDVSLEGVAGCLVQRVFYNPHHTFDIGARLKLKDDGLYIEWKGCRVQYVPIHSSRYGYLGSSAAAAYFTFNG